MVGKPEHPRTVSMCTSAGDKASDDIRRIAERRVGIDETQAFPASASFSGI
jgi:hypothetical protein